MHDDDYEQSAPGSDRTEVHDANEHEVVEEGSTSEVPEIMGSLPRTRPQRRSERRVPAGAERRFERARAPQPSPAQQDKPVTASDEPAPGLASLALGSAAAAAKLPLRIGIQVTLRALDSVARELRSR